MLAVNDNLWYVFKLSVIANTGHAGFKPANIFAVSPVCVYATIAFASISFAVTQAE